MLQKYPLKHQIDWRRAACERRCRFLLLLYTPRNKNRKRHLLSQARRGRGLGAGKGVLREKRQTPEIVVRKFNLIKDES